MLTKSCKELLSLGQKESFSLVCIFSLFHFQVFDVHVIPTLPSSVLTLNLS